MCGMHVGSTVCSLAGCENDRLLLMLIPGVLDVQNPGGREGGSSASDTQDVQVKIDLYYLYSVAKADCLSLFAGGKTVCVCGGGD